MTNINVNPERAQNLLDDIFVPNHNNNVDKTESTSKCVRDAKQRKQTVNMDTYKVIIVDELDLLYSERRPQVFYNLFDWPTSSRTRLILIAIANAMDLPEKFARGRINSRIGWNKIIFEPYTCDQLRSILEARLGSDLLNRCFDIKAILLATSRIGKTTGDARRILNMCCQVIEEAIEQGSSRVTAKLIECVCFRNMDRLKTVYLETCGPLEQLVLKGILKETDSQGETNVKVQGVYKQVYHMLKISENPVMHRRNFDYVYIDEILNRLYAYGLICLEMSKPLMERHVFIEDTRESFRDMIRSCELNL